MSAYNLQIGWSGKDAAGGIISGDDFHTEFTAAKNAINDKAEKAGDSGVAFLAATASSTPTEPNTTSQVATCLFVTTAITNLALGTHSTSDITISTSAPSGGADGDVHYQV